MAGAALRNHAARGGDPPIEVGVLGRIDVVEAAAEHRRRPGLQRAVMGGGVDAPRHA